MLVAVLDEPPPQVAAGLMASEGARSHRTHRFALQSAITAVCRAGANKNPGFGPGSLFTLKSRR
jgi:hypothetical protein